MGRFVLILVASVAITSLVYGVSSGDRDHIEMQDRAIARQSLNDAVSVVLDKAIDPTTRRWTPVNPVGDEISVGRTVVVDDYHLEDGGQVAVFTLTARAGGKDVTQTSRYLIADPGWPGPLWVDAPYAVSIVDPDARIDGTADDGVRGVSFDETRFNRYNLGSVLRRDDIPTDLGAGLVNARGDLQPVTMNAGMSTVLEKYRTPTVIELVGRALNEFGPDDSRFVGNTTVSSSRTFGDYDTGSPSKIVHVSGNLTVGPSGNIEGSGLLIVDGDLVVQGRLRWAGIIVVRTTKQELNVDLKSGDVEVRGSVVIDQEAPPPGGHTDLTINRSMNGTWVPTGGEWSGSGSGARPWLKHTHRIDFTIPEVRTFYFAERGRDRHESFTKFRETLSALTAQDASQKVYFRFRNPRNHGSALFHLVSGAKVLEGSVSVGFGANARQGDSWASPSFLPSAIDTFIVDVQSLRMLQHLTNNDTPTSPFWKGGKCNDRPQCVGNLPDRDGALAVQIVRDADDSVVYEGSIYWHSKEPGHAEFNQEQAADAAWRESIRNGTSSYGAKFLAGPGVDIGFDTGTIAQVLRRLRFNALVLTHVNSYMETSTPIPPTPTGGPVVPPSPEPPPAGTPTAEPPSEARIQVCHRGSTIEVSRLASFFHRFHGDPLGACTANDEEREKGRKERDKDKDKSKGRK